MGATWNESERDAARTFLAIVSPHHPAILVSNIEDLMPAKFREAFEALFAKLRPTVTIASNREPLDLDEVKRALKAGSEERVAAERTRKRSPRK